MNKYYVYAATVVAFALLMVALVGKDKEVKRVTDEYYKCVNYYSQEEKELIGKVRTMNANKKHHVKSIEQMKYYESEIVLASEAYNAARKEGQELMETLITK